MNGRSGAGTPAVVLTRPAGQADALAAMLASVGIEAVPFALLEIAPATDVAPLRAALAELESYAVVVFVSPNAIAHALRHFDHPWPAAVAAAVVGPGSAAALAAHGIAAPAYRVLQPDGGPGARFDSEALLAKLDVTALRGRKVLIVRGDGGRAWLAEALRAAGVDVRTVCAYVRRCPAPGATAWRAVDTLLEQGRPHAWLLTSSEAVRNLAALAAAHYDASRLRQLLHARCFAPHARIAEQAAALGFVSITPCGGGDENILRALQSWAEPYLERQYNRTSTLHDD